MRTIISYFIKYHVAVDVFILTFFIFGIYGALPRDHVFQSVDEAVRKLAPGRA